MRYMKAWCEHELERQSLVHEANLYHFTALSAGEYDPQEIFCEPVWFKPYEREPVSLLWQGS